MEKSLTIFSYVLAFFCLGVLYKFAPLDVFLGCVIFSLVYSLYNHLKIKPLKKQFTSPEKITVGYIKHLLWFSLLGYFAVMMYVTFLFYYAPALYAWTFVLGFVLCLLPSMFKGNKAANKIMEEAKSE